MRLVHVVCAPEANMTAARELDGDEQDDLVSAPRMVLQVGQGLRTGVQLGAQAF